MGEGLWKGADREDLEWKERNFKMAKASYWIWKDPSAPKIPDNWEKLSAKAYREFLQSPESEGRYFIRLGDDLHDNSEVIFIEATCEQYKDWRREHDQRKYLKRQAAGIELISADLLVTDDETMISEISDEAAMPEEELMRRERQKAFADAVRELNPEDRELLMTCAAGSIPTVRDLSEKRGVPRDTLYKQRKCIRDEILWKLRKY